MLHTMQLIFLDQALQLCMHKPTATFIGCPCRVQ